MSKKVGSERTHGLRAGAVSLALGAFSATAHASDIPDPYQWLEEVEGERALDWVRARNAESEAALSGDPAFEALRDRLLGIYDSDARIPHVQKIRGHYYNLWQDAKNPRGIWRRTTLDSYRQAEPAWETVLDLDALGAEEGVSWVWGGARCLKRGPARCLVQLSRGGADATVTRELDLETMRFVTDGFALPEAKGDLGWIDEGAVFVATDFGEGSLTASGYPRIVKRWQRGTPLSEAEVVYEGQHEDVFVGAHHDATPGFERSFIYRGTTFYSSELFQVLPKGLVKVEKPDDANATVHREWLFLELRSDWAHGGRTYTAGSLLVTSYDRWMKGKGKLEVLFEPTERTALASFSPTRGHLLLTTLDNVRNRVEVLTPGKKGWSRAALPGVPSLATVSVWAEDAEESDAYWLGASDYVTPSSLARGVVGQGAAETLKELPALFEASGLAVSQHEATSKDGTRVPYFQVAADDLALDGRAPTLLYGYGGFEVSLLPGYNAGVGAGWLEQGGVYVVANIRGGGEFGPRWHQAALKEHRHRAYEDFVAVGEDLVARGVTSPGHLGIAGGSNGGLLMGNMLTLRPDLWGAVLCKVPLLDMRRYHTLLAGASWMGEYGDPDNPDEWSFIRTFSPYHNVDAEVDYPPVLFTTSTRDDRVHPGHARKMAAKLVGLDKRVLYWENLEGGHGGAADNGQRATMDALGYRFLWSRLAPEATAAADEPEE